MALPAGIAAVGLGIALVWQLLKPAMPRIDPDDAAQVADPRRDIGDPTQQCRPLLAVNAGHFLQLAAGGELHIGVDRRASAIQASRSSRSITVIFGGGAPPLRLVT